MEVVERLVAAETRLDNHDRRLDSHGDRIGNLEQHNVRQDALLEKLCTSQNRTHDLTVENSKKLDSLLTQGKTVKWMVTAIVTGIPALVTLYLALRDLGWF